MTSELFVFLVLSLVAISSALGMAFSRNAIYSALFLVLNFVTVAVFYLLLGAPFIAMSQITVYAGAIMVLFLFVIMLLGAESVAPLPQAMPWQRPLAFILAVTLVVESIYLIFSRSQLNTRHYLAWCWCELNGKSARDGDDTYSISSFCRLRSHPFCCWLRWLARSC